MPDGLRVVLSQDVDNLLIKLVQAGLRPPNLFYGASLRKRWALLREG